MRPILTSSQKAAAALRRAEKTLRDWQDDPDSPRNDVNEMLRIIGELRSWVQGHVLADIDRARSSQNLSPPSVSEATEPYNHKPRDED